jgi:hypothetical protein
MEILEVDSKTYAEAIPNPSHVFNSAAFNALNSSKCDAVYYLLFKDSKVRLGIIFGVRNNILTSPFSAPFGGFEATSSDLRLQQIDAALQTLHLWATDRNFEGIRIVFPAFFYNSNMLNKVCSCLTRASYEESNVDLNYHFLTAKFDDNYKKEIWYNAQKNLKKSETSGLIFEKVTAADSAQAYAIIALNRRMRDFPLRMSLEQIEETEKVIEVDFFLVKKEEIVIASAIVFHVAKDIVQVVYWGDLPDYSEFKTMNYLSFHLFQHYENQGIKIIDIGPSTENSIPNYGLCEFKESIGCDILVKTEFYRKLESSARQNASVEMLEASKTLRDIDAKEYNYFFPHDPNPFISEKFISLNAHKVDRIVRLVQETDKAQIGLIAGIKDGVLSAPFSAPFGGFHFKHESIYKSAIESFLIDLLNYCRNENIIQIKLILPPNLYCQSFNTKVANTLIRIGFDMNTPEITNWVDLVNFKGIYTHNASRTYYNQAVNNNLEFHITDSVAEKEAIYNLIVENRARMGRSVYMTFSDVLETAKSFPTDFFKVINPEGNIVASAIFYRAHPTIAFAVFWGDSQEGRPLRAMDFLIFQLWSYYKESGFKNIDLGVSTEAGIPNEGLLRFKETHECVSSLRLSFNWSNKKPLDYI